MGFTTQCFICKNTTSIRNRLSKKQIGEDFTIDECVLNKLKINEQL